MIHNTMDTSRQYSSNNDAPRINNVSRSLLVLGWLLLLGNVGASSSAVSTITADDAVRILQNTAQDLQGEFLPSIPLSEVYLCIPPSEIKEVHENPNDTRLPWANGDSGAIQKECYQRQNSCGSNTASSACCRVSFEAGWLVCDAYNAFDFMPCVCNDNTFGSPTPEPIPMAPRVTSEPTKPPTVAPTARDTTVAPTVSPTKSPSVAPVAPTKAPITTASPTTVVVDPVSTDPDSTEATNSTDVVVTDSTGTDSSEDNPTTEVDATEAPVQPGLTRSPTRSPIKPPTRFPTRAPTKYPTQEPTVPLVYNTENKFDEDLSATIRQSQCVEDPPVITFVQGATFVYRYEVSMVYDEDSSSEDGPTSLDAENLEELTERWQESLHDEMAREFLMCDGYDYDTVWILQSKPHVIDETTPCGGDGNNLEITIEAANENAAEAMEASPNEDGSNDYPSCVSIKAEARIIAYQSPKGQKTTRQVWIDTTFAEGEIAAAFAGQAVLFMEDRLKDPEDLGFGSNFGISFVGGEVVSGTTNESGSDAGSDSGTNGSTTDGSTTGGSSMGGSTNGNSGTDNSNGDGGGTAVGIEGSNAYIGNTERKGLTPAMIATIAAVASVVFLVLFLGGRRRKNARENGEDKEYLQDASTPKSDSNQYSGGVVSHLDLSVSSDGNGGDVETPGKASSTPTNESPSFAHRGRMFQPPINPLSPKHFHFSGFSGKGVKSPTSKERNKMGPLGLADEFREQHNSLQQRYTSSTTDDSATGTHRGIVSNSSSMSSNNNNIFPAPPNQNNSPRLYQLRDTIKL